MTLAMTALIEFPAAGVVLRRPNSVEIESSWEMLTDTATIRMPRNVSAKVFNSQRVKELFKLGDPVSIYLGYDNKLIKEFSGFITSVSADIPIEIKCDDQMYRLKRHEVNMAMRTNKLKDLIADIIPSGIPTDVADYEISKQRFPRTTAAKVLEQLQEGNIYSYFKGDTLVVGKIYSDDQEPPVVFDLFRNVVDNQLNYLAKEDFLIRVLATSVLPKGRKIQAEFGDEGGETNELTSYNIASKEELLKRAMNDYKRLKVDKYEGHLEIFGIPSMRHGLKVDLRSSQYTDRNGIYWVKRVNKVFSDQGYYHQKLYLDQKVSTNEQ